jgi:hypothetical protein
MVHFKLSAQSDVDIKLYDQNEFLLANSNSYAKEEQLSYPLYLERYFIVIENNQTNYYFNEFQLSIESDQQSADLQIEDQQIRYL